MTRLRAFSRSPASLEQQLQRELNFAVAVRGVGEPAVRTGSDRRARVAKAGMVDRVVSFGAELQPEPLRDREVFQQSKIHIAKGRAEHGIALLIPVTRHASLFCCL